MARQAPRFDQLPMDVVFEVLGYLSVPEILRVREICQRLNAATRCKPVWINAWKRSGLLLPESSFSAKTADELETCVVRASKVEKNLVSQTPTNYTRRIFPRQLPTYEFDVNMLDGRYLQLAERNGLSWYDLDGDDLSKPVLVYSCPQVMPMEGYLSHQQNANGEGRSTYWVTFISTQPYQLNVLKVELSPTRCNAKLHTTVPLRHPAPIRIAFDWILLPKDFPTMDDHSPIPILHIPSKSCYKIAVHEEITDVSDLCNTHYVISPRHLVLMSSFRTETLVNVFPLPANPSASSECPGSVTSAPKPNATKRTLVRSHRGVYPHALSSIRLVETRRKHVDTPESPDSPPYSSPPSPSTPSSFPSPSFSVSSSASSLSPAAAEAITLLGLVYLAPSPLVQTWTSKIGLHMMELCLHPNGSLALSTMCSRTLDVGIMTTSLALTASTNSNSCLAMTHSTPGPFLIAHHLKTDPDKGMATMDSKVLKLPVGLNSRTMVSFDGYSGRVCLLNGWTFLEILDYSDYDTNL